MKLPRFIGVSVITIAASGCSQSLEQVRAEPVKWRADYDVALEPMANCIAGGAIEWGTPLVQHSSSEGITRIVLMQTAVADSVLGEFTVERQGGAATSVSWKTRGKLAGGTGFERWSKGVADRCGKAPSGT